jgi:hypothetical protein
VYGDAVSADRTLLSNAELAEWVTKELRRGRRDTQKSPEPPDCGHALEPEHWISAKDEAWANEIRAMIAGQQAILRDLPNLELSGDFSVAPAPQGGWIVRYSVRRADDFGTAPSGVVECVVAANGAPFIRKISDISTRSPDAKVN